MSTLPVSSPRSMGLLIGFFRGGGCVSRLVETPPGTPAERNPACPVVALSFFLMPACVRTCAHPHSGHPAPRISLAHSHACAHPRSLRYWITNGAVHAKHCVVFARLLVDGKDNGIHGVLVRIRDNNLNVMPGVRVCECFPSVCFFLPLVPVFQPVLTSACCFLSRIRPLTTAHTLAHTVHPPTTDPHVHQTPHSDATYAPASQAHMGTDTHTHTNTQHAG